MQTPASATPVVQRDSLSSTAKDASLAVDESVEDSADADPGILDMDAPDPSFRKRGLVQPDTTAKPIHYGWEPTQPSTFACREMAETLSECLRGHVQWTGVSSGFPGSPAHYKSLGSWEPIAWYSPYQAGNIPNGYSPYRQGGLRLPDSLVVIGPEMQPDAIGETWRPTAPLDTPLTRLRWQRGALVFNQFQVDLDRALAGGSYVGFSYASQTADSQGYDYSFNVHQPYLSGWGALGKLYAPIDRDSASLVIEGLSPSTEANHMRPRLGFWIDSNQVLELFYDRVRNRTNLAMPRNLFQRDSALAPLGSLFESDGLGLLYGGMRGAWSYSAGYVHTGALRSLYPVATDTSIKTVTGVPERQWTTDRFEAQARGEYPSWFLQPWLRLESEQWQGPLRMPGGASVADGEGWRDRESFGFHAGNQTDSRFESRSDSRSDSRTDAGWTWTYATGTALHRESRLTDKKVWLPEGYLQSHLATPWGTHLEWGGTVRRTDPGPEMLVDDAWVLNRAASPDLEPRWEEGVQAILRQDGKRLAGYAGLESYWTQNAWGPRVMPSPVACADVQDSLYAGLTTPACIQNATLSDTLALRQRNFDSRERLQILASVSLGLGNWRLWLENRFLAFDRIHDGDLETPLDVTWVPQRVFRGQLHWTRRLIENRMRVLTQWNWEWISTRQAWAGNGNGTATALKLDEYLTLDFYAAMQIKTFTLHFRAQNMNHDRYAPEPGVHPPGVNFRFGIDWALMN
jgi:hypothetical protein